MSDEIDLLKEGEDIPVNTLNEWAIGYGKNLDNHSSALAGRAGFIRQMDGTVPTFRTKQEAYRYAAYLISMAEVLPDEDGEHTFEEVLSAIQNV